MFFTILNILMEKELCPPDKIVFDAERGEYICTETGEVIEEKVIDQGPEWRAYTAEEKIEKSRVGSPINQAIHDFGFSTVIDWKDSSLDADKKVKMMRLRKWQLRAKLESSRDRNLARAMVEIERLSSLLNLPKAVKVEAALLYRKVVEKDLIRGRSIEEFVAACIYIACRKVGVVRTLDEIAKYTKAKKKDIARCYRVLVEALKIKVPMSDPRDFVIRAERILNLKAETVKKAIEIVEGAKKAGLTGGREPAAIAAGAIYIACILTNDMRSQKDIARALGVSEITLRSRYKEIARKLNISISPRENQ